MGKGDRNEQRIQEVENYAREISNVMYYHNITRKEVAQRLKWTFCILVNAFQDVTLKRNTLDKAQEKLDKIKNEVDIILKERGIL